MQPILFVKRLSEYSTLPIRATTKAAGYDLFAAHDETIAPHGKALVKTDISIAIPIGFYGRIAPRSSLAWGKHIDVGAGVIDEDYRGPVRIVLFNHGNEDFKVVCGDRVAQLIITKILTPDVIEVDDLDITDRGQNGFGSTGK